MLGDLNKLKVVELKAELATRGLDTKGVKAVLVDRLKAALDEEGGGATFGSPTSGGDDQKSSQESNDEVEDVPLTPSRRGRRAMSTKESEQDDQDVAPVQQEDVVPAPIQEDLAEPMAQDLSTPFEQERADPFEQEQADPLEQVQPAPTEQEEPAHIEQEEPAHIEQEEPAHVEQEQPAHVEQEEPAHVEQEAPFAVAASNDDDSHVLPDQQQELLTAPTGLQSQYPDNGSPQFGAVSVQDDMESSESKDSSEPPEDSSSFQGSVEPQPPATVDQDESVSYGEQDSKPSSTEVVEDSQLSMPESGEHQQACSAEMTEDTQVQNFSENAHDSMDIKVEPPDVQQVKSEEVSDLETALDAVKDEQGDGSRRARKSRFTDNDDVNQGGAEVKDEPMDSEVAPADTNAGHVKSESSNDRKRRRSSSRSPRRSRSPPPRRQDDEPDIDQTAVLLSWYDSDLNLIIEKDGFLTATPMHTQGFAYVWAGARASFGFCKGKVCFEVKCLEELDVSHLEDEPNPHVLRVGWSVQGTSMQLGEEQLSYGYGGTGKGSVNCQFKDYGKAFGVGDTITAYLDLDSEPKIISYSVNGESQGVAYEISSEALADKALFPHILTKNVKFSVNFAGEPAYPIMEGYSLCGLTPLEDRVAGPQRPEKKEECEMIMMCGLPGCGKTVWANKHAAENPDKLYNILGTNNLIEKMKVMGLPRKRNYTGRWEVLIDKCTKCLQKLFEIAGRRRRNYILDQTNVYPSAVRRKMRSFDGFKRKAVVIVPADDEFQKRVAQQVADEGKDIAENAVYEMKANFKVPEVGESFSEVIYVELQEEEAKAMVEKYREEAKGKGFLAQLPQSKRFKSERSGSSGDRRYDDRSHSRDSRDHGRDRRDHRDNRDRRDYGDRANSYRPRGGPGGDRNRSGWQPRGGQGGGWRDRGNDNFRGGRSDNRGSWRSGGGRSGMGGGGYDRHRSGGYNQGRGGYGGGRGGSKGWGYNQGSGGSSWGSWNQQAQPDYSQQWQSHGQGQSQSQSQSSGYSSSWKGYGQQQQSQQHQAYGQQPGYSTQGYSSYGNGSNAYNWNQQYYQNYGAGWGQQQAGATAGTSAITGASATPSSAVASAATTAYDPYQQQQWNQFSSYGYSTSSGSAAAGATGSTSHGGK